MGVFAIQRPGGLWQAIELDRTPVDGDNNLNGFQNPLFRPKNGKNINLIEK